MAVVPIFGDQPANADSVARCGAGLSFRQPLDTVSSESLRSAFLQLGAKDSSFRAAARSMSEKIKDAGGVHVAAQAILDAASAGTAKGSLGGA